MYTISVSRGGGGVTLDNWNGGTNVLIRALRLGIGEIIWGLKFRGP